MLHSGHFPKILATNRASKVPPKKPQSNILTSATEAYGVSLKMAVHTVLLITAFIECKALDLLPAWTQNETSIYWKGSSKV